MPPDDHRAGDIIGYRGPRRCFLTDILIRDVPSEVVAALDANARRLGLSRNDYLRRHLLREASGANRTTLADLERFAEAFADLRDPEIMARAWE